MEYMDFGAAETPNVTSELSGIANEESTEYCFSQANFLAIDFQGFNPFVHGEASESLTKNDSHFLLNTIVRSISYSEDGAQITNAAGSVLQLSTPSQLSLSGY